MKNLVLPLIIGSVASINFSTFGKLLLLFIKNGISLPIKNEMKGYLLSEMQASDIDPP